MMPAYITEAMVDALTEHVPEGSTILELGTGRGTLALAEKFDVISVENQSKWHLGKSKLFHIPLVGMPEGMWYDPEKLTAALDGQAYDGILVDGPKGGKSRQWFSKYYEEIFDTTVPVLIDDLWRPTDWLIALEVARVKDSRSFEIRRDIFTAKGKTHEKVYTII
jgi:hypothetical protein